MHIVAQIFASLSGEQQTVPLTIFLCLCSGSSFYIPHGVLRPRTRVLEVNNSTAPVFYKEYYQRINLKHVHSHLEFTLTQGHTPLGLVFVDSSYHPLN
jgi:hypothetical protein